MVLSSARLISLSVIPSRPGPVVTNGTVSSLCSSFTRTFLEARHLFFALFDCRSLENLIERMKTIRGAGGCKCSVWFQGPLPQTLGLNLTFKGINHK